MMDAKITMLAALALMPMPSYAENSVPRCSLAVVAQLTYLVPCEHGWLIGTWTVP
jgi:hypothetical protein